MAENWKEAALAQVWLGRMNPDHTPRYRVPARAWWQLWKPRWQWMEGVSENSIRLAHGLPRRETVVKVLAL